MSVSHITYQALIALPTITDVFIALIGAAFVLLLVYILESEDRIPKGIVWSYLKNRRSVRK